MLNQSLSPTIIDILSHISLSSDCLICEKSLDVFKNSNIYINSQQLTNEQQLNLIKLKESLGPGIWTSTKTVINYISNILNRNNQACTTNSPLILNFKEFACCKTIKFHSGNIITGRDKEISELLLTLCRGSKRGCILVGQPGTGKTAIVREINNRILQRTVPRQLLGCQVLNMDLPYIFSVYKQDPIGAIVSVLERAMEYDKVILFIDEVHQLLGHRLNDVMKPYLTEKIRFIGSTTIDEYHTIINEDKALERRFTVISVEEPNIDKTIEMVIGTKSVFEEYHKCIISSEIAKYAVVNGSRFLGQRKNPDKSLDVLDIACSILSENEITEQSTIHKRTGNALKDIKSLEADFNSIKLHSGNRVLTEYYIDRAISSLTGINYGDIQKSLNYADVVTRLNSNIIGQESSIKTIANVVNIFKHIKYDRVRPVTILLVAGPAGCGKKSACKYLAKYLFGSDNYFIDYDMSGFTSEFTISELKGAPPGYVGYGKSGRLIKEIKNQPQSVVYFGKINKANDKIKQYLFDACKTGKLTDSADREAKLNNTIIVFSVTLTEDETNEVNKGKLKTMGFTKNNNLASKEKVIKSLIGEELANNIDDIILFNSLTKDNLKQIYDLNVQNYLETYNVDINKNVLMDRVINESNNGHDIISKLSSIVPQMVFSKLGEENG